MLNNKHSSSNQLDKKCQILIFESMTERITLDLPGTIVEFDEF